MPPDRHFVIDRLPDHPDIVVLLGAAHGFKFASLLGKVASELALDGRSDVDLSHFSVSRPVLRMENPPTSFLV
jgi:sarcosine oxidase